MNWLLDAEPAPALLVLPPAAASLDEAEGAIELWEHYSGKTLDPTQRLSVQVMMAEASPGRWAAATTGREMPRQNGKGDEIEVVELWGLVQRGEAILHTVHDAVLLASQTQQRMLAVLEQPDLRQRVKRKWKGTGQQMIELRNGGTIWYRTRTGGGGRGVDDIDRLVVDEAQHATEEHLAAVAPTLLANENSQLNAMGTSGLEGRSDWWWSVRRRALSESPGSFGYVGHTAERVSLADDGQVEQLPVDVHDRKLWVMANPSVTAGRGQGMEFLEEQLLRLGEASFAREHMGVWDPPPGAASADAKLPADRWALTVGPPTTAGPGEVSIGFGVSRDGAHASIAIASGSLAEPYVEVIDHRRESSWLPARLVELVETWNPIAVGFNNAGPAAAQAGAVLEAFRAADVDAGLLVPVNTGEYKRACGGFFTDVVEDRVDADGVPISGRPRLVRPDGQGPLDVAAAEASERPLGDAWAWDVRNASVPISPLEAATVARFLLPTERPVVYDPLASVL